MTAAQLPLAEQAHSNHQLFSDHYLNAVLPGRSEWNALKRDAAPVMEQIAALFADYHHSDNEAQTEKEWIQPVLTALGHTFEVQTSLETPGNVKSPDYVFYDDRTKLLENKGKRLNEENLQGRAFAVGDAKYWGRKLDVAERSSGADPFGNKNPSYQIAFYIQHSGLEWGILTNGRLWRLYHRSNAHKLDRYYEVDLPELLETGSVDRFLYFYAFFNRRAFDRQSLGVSAILQASADYALGVGESLKAQVFEALRHLGQGFLDYPDNRLEPDPDTLKAIYDNSLIVLYRLLFVFYAEARELLPVRTNDAYRRSYSLRAITHDAAREADLGHALLATSNITWPKLRQLFQIIDLGSPELDVPTYNGGLFDPRHHPFIEQYTVGDAHLQRAIDILAVVDGQFIDYRDLAEQHLGTIYEGLLEYHLASIESEGGWTVDIFNDRGERKQTGSYYTPNYIVKYIVEQAVGPVLREAVKGKKTDREKIDAVLKVNVLDPAMGSGYFLVEATEFIARFLIDLDLDPAVSGGDEPDLAFWKRRVAQSCIYGVDLNPLAVDLAKLSMWLTTVSKDQPLSFLDHHLRTGNSLVGAWVSDLQPRTEGKRRRQSTKTRRAQEAGQLSLLDDETFARNISIAVDSMWLIEGMAGDTVEDVKEQERVYREMRERLTGKYGRLADLVTATRFGLEIDLEFWGTLTAYATGRVFTAPDKLVGWVTEAESIANREHFFHWELEFPEVFFDGRGQPLRDLAGFDAVVGNPPYVRQERLAPLKPFFEEVFQTFQSTADLYLYFYEQGIRLLQNDGRLGYISSGTFTRGNFAKKFREVLPTIAQLEQVIDFGENQPFKGAEMVRPSILVATKGNQLEPFSVLFLAADIPESLEVAMRTDAFSCDPRTLRGTEWSFQPLEITTLSSKLFAADLTLENAIHEGLYRGLTTGLNEAFVIDDEMCDHIRTVDSSKSQIFIKRAVQGQDLRPWYQEDEGRWLIVVPSGWTAEHYGPNLDEEAAWSRFCSDHPALAKHLNSYADGLRKRYDQGGYWWELRSCEYYWAFETPKIFWPDISKLPRFSWDESGTFITNTGYIIPNADAAILAVLQSRVTWFAISQICQPLRLRAGLWQYRLLPQFVDRLPIPKMSPEDAEELRKVAHEIGALSNRRYALHNRTRSRIWSDLGTPDRKLNLKLTAWWDLDFGAFRAEIKKVFKREIPVGERDQWETWLAEQRAEHERLTGEIIRLETDLNERVYALYDLTPEEITLIEEVTKYEYGEV